MHIYSASSCTIWWLGDENFIVFSNVLFIARAAARGLPRALRLENLRVLASHLGDFLVEVVALLALILIFSW